MIIHIGKAGKVFTLKDFLKDPAVDHQGASAVLTDICDALRRVILLQQNESGPCLPYAKHGNKGLHAPWKYDIHEIFPSYPMILQVTVHLSRDQVQLPVCNILSIPHG